MLSGNKMTENGKQLPPPPPITVRLRFQKIGSLQYISHLDLQRTLQRILVRADLPMWYTKGFNPHMKIVFSAPLSIGVESICEMVDIRLECECSNAEILDRINRQVTDELRVTNAYTPTTKFSDIMWSKYQFVLHAPSLSKETVHNINTVMNSEELLVTKKTKSGEKTFSVLPMVRDLSAFYDETQKGIHIHAFLRVDGENYLNPDLFLLALRRACGILEEDESFIRYSILREENFLADGITPFR